MKHHFSIKNIGTTPSKFNKMPFGQQIEFLRKLEEFKSRALTDHFNQKRSTFTKGLKEFLALNEVGEYLTVDSAAEGYKDDSTQIWYTKKEKKSS
jgi:hypothetical protein